MKDKIKKEKQVQKRVVTKNLSARIAERVLKKKTSQGSKNRAIFLSLRTDIQHALDDGWPIKTIWEQLVEEGKVTFSYQAFRNYVIRLTKTPKQEVDSQADTASNASKKGASQSIGGFSFDPIPKKEDLV
jgi:hypothetical protein